MFDGRKNLYSRDPLPIGKDKVIQRRDNRNNFRECFPYFCIKVYIIC